VFFVGYFSLLTLQSSLFTISDYFGLKKLRVKR